MKTARFLFNDDMARAIVQGRKTVTRRPVMPHDIFDDFKTLPPLGLKAPCAPGDILIGRECWRVFGGISDVRVDYRAGGDSSIISREVERIGGAVVHYLPDVSRLERPAGKWRPSIHMPDWAARIRRRVVSVTVERLQDISEADAVREGFVAGDPEDFDSACVRFGAAWDSIYAANGLGWDVNPWVFRIEFGGQE